MIPVALNLYRIRSDPGPAGELFRSIQRQKDQYQGIWIVSPEGRVLAAHHEVRNHARWADEVLATIDAGLRAFGEVAPRPVAPEALLPQPGVGRRADGGVVLALSARYLHEGRPDGPPVIDRLSLSAADWAGLAPAPAALRTLAQQQRPWRVPEAVARQLCRGLSPVSDRSTMPEPEDVTAVELIGTVRGDRGGEPWIEYAGSIAAVSTRDGRTRRAEARIEGALRYRGGTPSELHLLLHGVYRDAPPYDAPREIGALFEWRATAAPATM